MQLYIFITVQILAYFYTEYLYNFFTSKGGGQAQGPPKYAPASTPLANWQWTNSLLFIITRASNHHALAYVLSQFLFIKKKISA